jgi:hypothetical protein
MQGQFLGTYWSFTPTQIVVAAIVTLLVVDAIVVALVARSKARTRAFRNRYGLEYDRAVLAHGSARHAEAKLAARESRVEALQIRELGATERDRFIAEWQTVQSRFVDHPRAAVTEADDLVNAILETCGYSHTGFEQRAADVSVTYPRVTENYRLAHGIAARPSKSEATTEELRTAMIQYRAMFDELVQTNRPANQQYVA